MMNFAIIDDSLQDLSFCYRKIFDAAKKVFPNIKIDGFLSYDEYHVSQDSYYITFLDIELNDKFNGLDLFNKISDKTKVVFITNHDHFIYDAFHLSAFDFVRKHELENYCSSLVEKIAKEYSNDNFVLPFDNPALKKIYTNDILYFESDKNYEICKANKTSIRFRATQKELIYSLGKMPRNPFVRINRTLIVNSDKVDRVDGIFAILTNGESLPICKQDRKSIIKKLNQNLIRDGFIQ